MYYPNHCHCHNNWCNYYHNSEEYNNYNDSCYNRYPNSEEYNNYNDNSYNINYYDNNCNDCVEDFNTDFNFNRNREKNYSNHDSYNTSPDNYSYNFWNQGNPSLSQSQYSFQNNFPELGNEKSNGVDEKYIIESEKLENIGYYIVVVRGDGNCLFRSVAEQLDGNEDDYKKYRETCVDYMINNKEDFIPFLEDSTSIDEYIEKISKDGEWGGNLEIYSLSMALKVNFCIYIPDKPCSVVKNWENPKKSIFLIYHDGKHYNSLRKLKFEKSNNEIKEKEDGKNEDEDGKKEDGKKENDDEKKGDDDEKKEGDDEKKENIKEEEQKEKDEENKENVDKNIGKDKDKKTEKYDEINDFLYKVKNFLNYSL